MGVEKSQDLFSHRFITDVKTDKTHHFQQTNDV